MFGLGGLMGGMGGLGGMMGGAGGAAGAAGAAGGAAGGGFMSTLGSIGQGLGRAANYYNEAGKGGQAARPVSGWTDASQPNTLQDEIKKQMQAMKQEQVMRDLMRYQPLEGQGGISGLTVNPYK